MAALLLLLLAAAWSGDGLLRRLVDPQLHRGALVGRAGQALAGIALLAFAIELALPIGVPLARSALHAFALVLVGACLAPDDAGATVGAGALHRLREVAPPADALALALLAAWLLAATDPFLQDALRLSACAGLLLFVRLLAPAFDLRLATAGNGTRLQLARLGSALVLSLALLGMRAWLP